MRTLNILMIEDNPQDVLLIGQVLEASGLVNTLSVASNGEEALRLLNQVIDSESRVLPDIILLDINMPIMDGHETLIRIKNDENFKHVPVIMLTTSSDKNDIKKAYQHYSNSYIVKPYEFSDIDHIVQTLKEYWLNTVHLPK